MGLLSSLRSFVAQIYFGAANEALRRERYGRALRAVRRAIELDPEGRDNLFYQSCLGRCYLHCGDYEKAMRVLSTTLARMDEDQELWSRDILNQEYRQVSEALDRSRQGWGKEF